MTEPTSPVASPETDTWCLAAIQALCVTLQRRAIDRLANVHDDRKRTTDLLRFLTLAGEALKDQTTLEEALACLEKAGGRLHVQAASSGDEGESCPWPWTWDDDLKECILFGN